MANSDFYRITERIGSEPVQLAVGQNPDADIRYRIDVTYSYQGEERRRTWYTRSQLQSIFALLGVFFNGDAEGDGAEPDVATSNGSKPPFE
jgi:hypothetical protein